MRYCFAKSLIVNQIRLFRLFPPFSLFQRIRLKDFPALVGTCMYHWVGCAPLVCVWVVNLNTSKSSIVAHASQGINLSKAGDKGGRASSLPHRGENVDLQLFSSSNCSIGSGPKQKNENFITAVCFFTVIIHINDLENVCNHEKID